jgi:hypothetical protein
MVKRDTLITNPKTIHITQSTSNGATQPKKNLSKEPVSTDEPLSRSYVKTENTSDIAHGCVEFKDVREMKYL